MSLSERLLHVYERLFAAYGPQSWWPAADDPFEVIAGAILTQSAAWSNVERALENLKGAEAVSPQAFLDLSETELAELVRPSGYFNMKARKLLAFAAMVAGEFDGDLSTLLALPLPELRARLLSTYGIGPETADDIILYAANQPIFVIDAYTVRLFTRLGLTPDTALTPDHAADSRQLGTAVSPRHRSQIGDSPQVQSAIHNPQSEIVRGLGSYDAWQRLFMDNLPHDVALFNEYHALIVRHGVVRCRKRAPLCDGCPLFDLCPSARSGMIMSPNKE